MSCKYEDMNGFAGHRIFHITFPEHMASEEERFPKTVFIKKLPKEYELSDLAQLLEQFGALLEIELLEDGNVMARFQESEAARSAVNKASGKKGSKLSFLGKNIYVIPKRNRK